MRTIAIIVIAVGMLAIVYILAEEGRQASPRGPQRSSAPLVDDQPRGMVPSPGPAGELGRMLDLLCDYRLGRLDAEAKVLREALDGHAARAPVNSADVAERREQFFGRLTALIETPASADDVRRLRRYYGDVSELCALDVRAAAGEAERGRETVLRLAAKGPPETGCCAASPHPKCEKCGPIIEAVVGTSCFTREDAERLLGMPWPRQCPTVLRYVLRSAESRWCGVAADAAREALRQSANVDLIYEASIALLRLGDVTWVASALQNRREQVMTPVLCAIADGLPEDAAFALLEEMRRCICSEWPYSVGYQMAVSESYSRLFARGARSDRAAFARRVVSLVEEGRAESEFRDTNAVFSSVVAAHAKHALTGGQDALSLASIASVEERLALEAVMSKAVERAYGGCEARLSVNAFGALACLASTSETFLRAAEATLARCSGEGLDLDIITGIHLISARGLCESESARAGVARVMEALLERAFKCDRPTARASGLGAWLRACRAQGWPELQTAVQAAASRISADPGLRAASGELVPLVDEAMRAVSGRR